MSPRPRRPPTPHDVERLAGAATDSRAFRVAVLDRLRGALPFASYAWVLTDPVTTVGADPLADVPDLAELPAMVRLRYQGNRWTNLDPVAVLGPAASDSRLWREVQRGHGVVDVASVVFRDAFGCWGFLDLWSGQRFSATDVAVLRGLAPPVTTALRRLQARTFRDLPDAVPPPVPVEGPVVLLLDDELRVTGRTPATEPWLRALLGDDEGRPPVPAVAYNVAAQLLAREAGVDAHAPTARVRLVGTTWVTARASRVEPAATIAVTLEPTAPDDRLDLYGRAHGLSPREHELLAHLARGTDTRELAALMALSPHTVQDHLKSIFAKTGTHTRRVLVSQVLGASPGPGATGGPPRG